MRSLISLLFLILALATPPLALADSQTSGMTEKLAATATDWKNQSGSIASLSFVPSTSQPGVYIVSGNYVNNAAGFNCQGTPYPLSGAYYAANQTISFAVAWSNGSDDCASVTGWTGYLDLSKTPWEMVTFWNLAYLSAGGSQILQGKDNFTMIVPRVSESIFKN